MVDRKIFAMHKRFGACGAMRCKDCDHLIGGKWHDKQYYKCELYGVSRSDATDWRLSYQACGMYDIEVNLELWVPVLEQVKHAQRPRKNEQLPGQMDIGDLLS